MEKQSLGEMIASLRKQHNMTQAQLAELMNVTDKAVSKWERNLSCPDIESLPRLAEIFEVSVDQLMQVKQIKTISKPNMISLVLKTVTLAMGVAVAVLSLLGALETKDGMMLLGIGLACVGILQLKSK
ncbi:MAG: helix-turn-helix transcriptional regulator [Clostridia bacterium]|nr:helix-turn-helix transcriptional regulator [Clostridia bacterium]